MLLLRFNPLFAAGGQFGLAAVFMADDGADDDVHRAGVFQKRIFRPKFAAVEGDGDNVHFKQLRHSRRAAFVTSLAARCNPRAFGKNGNPIAFVAPLPALFGQLGVGLRAAAFDAYGFDDFQPPAEEGDFKQFALGHEHLRRENFLQGERFPAALVFGANNGRFVGDVLRADQPVFQADDVFQRPH